MFFTSTLEEITALRNYKLSNTSSDMAFAAMRHRGRTVNAIITIPRFVALIVFVVNILYSIKGQHNASHSLFMLDDAPKHENFASGYSAFVPMESIPEGERQVFPGLFYYGIGNVSKTPLILTGAAMAGDYHDSNALWLHLFGMGGKMFKQSNLGECYSRDERKNGVQLSGGGFRDLRTFTEMKDEIFLCRIGARTARFELMPTDSYDGNTNEIAQVWRCPLHGISGREPVLSNSDFQQLRRHSTDHNTVLTIDVLHEGAELTSVLKLHLPIAEPSLGIQHMISHMPAKPSFIHERHNVTLCTVAHANGIRYLNELFVIITMLSASIIFILACSRTLVRRGRNKQCRCITLSVTSCSGPMLPLVRCRFRHSGTRILIFSVLVRIVKKWSSSSSACIEPRARPNFSPLGIWMNFSTSRVRRRCHGTAGGGCQIF